MSLPLFRPPPPVQIADLPVAELIAAFRAAGVLETFFLLPREDQSDFLRWVGATDDSQLRRDRTGIFVTALGLSPLARGKSGLNVDR